MCQVSWSPLPLSLSLSLSLPLLLLSYFYCLYNIAFVYAIRSVRYLRTVLRAHYSFLHGTLIAQLVRWRRDDEVTRGQRAAQLVGSLGSFGPTGSGDGPD